jgi:plastocyanin
MTRRLALLLLLAVAGAATYAGGLALGRSLDRPSEPAASRSAATPARTSGVAAPRPRPVDPRAGGLEIGLGEWALTPEARAIRPGRVTFVIRNRGRMTHGFEIEVRRLGGRHGGGHDGKAESAELRPGQSTTLTLNLGPGVYEIECSVGEHDDLGMRGVLEVRPDAPLVAPRPATSSSTVEISGFAFKPAKLTTTAGSVVTWRNADPAPHTASGEQFSSPQLRKGASYRHRFTRPGTYTYVCALHPGMRGRVVVSAKRGK